MVSIRGMLLRRLCIPLRLSLLGALLSSIPIVPRSNPTVCGTTTSVTMVLVMVLKLPYLAETTIRVEVIMVIELSVLPTILRNVVPTPTPLLCREVRTKTETTPVVRFRTFMNSSKLTLLTLVPELLNRCTLVLTNVQTLMMSSIMVFVVVASILSSV